MPKAISTLVDDGADRLRCVIAHGFFEQRTVVVLLHGLEDQRRVGGRVLRLVLGELLEVTGIGDDSREFLELIECGSHVEPSRRTSAMVQRWRVPQR